MRGTAKIVTAVDQGQPARQRLQIQRPIERAVAATDDDDRLVAEVLHAPHGVGHGLALVGLDAGDRRLLRLEGAASRRNHDRLAGDRLAYVGADAEGGRLRRAQGFDRLDHLAEVEGRVDGSICSISLSTRPCPVTLG